MTPGYAAALGACRGAVGALVYAAVLALGVFLSDGADGGSPLVVVVYVSVIAAPLGAVAGALLGAPVLLLVRRVRAPWSVLLVVLGTLAVGVAAFPVIPFGDRPDDVEGFLLFSLLPAACGAGAAGWHAWRLSLRAAG